MQAIEIQETTAFQSVFERVEQKYLLTPAQYEALVPCLRTRMEPDVYGRHTVQNVYWDTDQYSLLRASIEKPVYKEKLRVRSYGVPKAEGTVFVELKKKYRGIVYKRRVPMSLAQSDAYLLNHKKPCSHQILREMDQFMAIYPIQPRVFIAYERTAWSGCDQQDLRITFDEDIRWRQDRLDLSKGSQGAPLLDSDRILMEVKIPGATPLWLSRALSGLSVFPTSFSKAGACYTQYLIHGEMAEGGVLSA